jgi:hypothetical protein
MHQTFELHKEIQHSCLRACSPYLCAQNLVDHLLLSILPVRFSPPLESIFVNNIFSPFGTNDRKGPILDRISC